MKSFLFKYINGVWFSDNNYLSSLFSECEREEIGDKGEIFNRELIQNIEESLLKGYNPITHFLSVTASNDGSVISYVEKTEDTLEQYYLTDKKIDKLTALDLAYKLSQKITIQNGKTLIIEHDTLDRKYFDTILTNYVYDINASDELSSTVTTYAQDGLVISMLPIFWNRLLNSCFKKPTSTGLSENINSYNGLLNKKLKRMIQKCTTAAELDLVHFDFYKADGIVISITAEAEKLQDSLIGREDYDFLMGLVNSPKGVDGTIHLIQEQ
jgi:hypothetical protein